jgi:phosphoribosyl 1,2-cyclic phosphate phosphodiesterase
MRLEILGSGGAMTTPRPGCDCRVCVEARLKGVPYSRTGPSFFLHGPDVLFDTPEESKEQLNRSHIPRVAACFYSHWHPDHVMGRRIFETLHADWRYWPRRVRGTTIVYLPEQVAADFRERLAGREHLGFMAERGWIEIVELADGETVGVDGVDVRPFRVAEDYVYAFLLFEGAARVLLAPDELLGWDPPEEVRGVDLAVLPMGICELDPLTGERRIDREHPILRFEATFAETLSIVERLGARRTVLAHIEELDRLSHDDLVEVGRRHGLEFAHDTMLLEV